MHVLKLRNRIAFGAGVFGLTAISLAAAEVPSRIVEHVDDGQTFTLPGHVHPKVRNSTDLGVVPGSFDLPTVTIHLQRSAAQQQELNQLLQEQQDPKSPNYHKWLTPEQFANRFGASKSDVSKIKSWAESNGFSHVKTARTRTFLSMSGTAAHAQAAFQTTIHSYQTPDAVVHFANATDPVLPHAFEGVVSAITGLNDFHPKPRTYSMRPSPRFTSSISGNHFVVPADFATIYDLNALYNAGINGSGVKIAIPGQTDLDMAQVQAFRSAAGLSTNQPQPILTGVDPGVSADDQLESYLDVEWAGAAAPSATIIYVYGKDVFDNSFQYIVDQNLASVVPLTYGLCEAQFGPTTAMDSLLQTANAEGITVTAASGDLGVADCDEPDPTNPNAQPPASAKDGLAVDYPGTSWYVTDVGGTEFNENGGNYWASTNGIGQGSALGYIPEMVWNDTAANNSLSAGGGGVSTLFTKPSWQTGNGVPNDGMRDVPDISLLASTNHDPVLICASDGTVTQNGKLQTEDCTNGFRDVNEDLDAAGGTSVGSPSFAGIVALMVQEYGAQGNINQRLYSLAASSSNAFHDITVGNNDVPCQTGTPNCTATGNYGVYNAASGYDQASGLGSVDAANLVDQWAPSFQLSLNPTSVTITGGNAQTSTLTISGENGFSGTVGLSCTVSSALTNTTCSVPSSVTGPGTAAVTVTNSNSSLAPPFWPRHLPPAAFLWLALLMAGGFAIVWHGRKLRLASGALATAAVLTLASCGGGSSSSSTNVNSSAVTVTGSVTITAVSGSMSKSITLSVTED